MARIRSIHPSVCKSRTFAGLPARLERTFFRLLTYCDDAGRGDADPRLIKCELYPLDDGMTVGEVEADLSGLATVGLLEIYEVGDRSYIQVTAWDTHQKPQKPRTSTIPPPRPLPLPDDSHNATVGLPFQSAAGEGIGIGIGEGEGQNGNTPTRGRPRSQPTTVPDDFKVTSEMRDWATEHHPSVNLRSETGKFLDYHRSKGSLMKDWIAAWRYWLRRSAEFSNNTNGHGPPRRVQEKNEQLRTQIAGLRAEGKHDEADVLEATLP